MAEINLQRKGAGAWLWILGLLAAVGIVWLVAGTAGDDDQDDGVDAVATVAPATPRETAATSGAGDTLPADVAALVTFAESSDPASAGRTHEYAADGIRRLTRALQAVVEQQTVDGSPVQKQFMTFRTKADRIQADPQAAGHADQVRDVFTSAAELMTEVQKERWPEAADLRAQIEDSRAAASEIDAGRPLLEQTAQVDAFFDRTANALRSMSARR